MASSSAAAAVAVATAASTSAAAASAASSLVSSTYPSAIAPLLLFGTASSCSSSSSTIAVATTSSSLLPSLLVPLSGGPGSFLPSPPSPLAPTPQHQHFPPSPGNPALAPTTSRILQLSTASASSTAQPSHAYSYRPPPSRLHSHLVSSSRPLVLSASRRSWSHERSASSLAAVTTGRRFSTVATEQLAVSGQPFFGPSSSSSTLPPSGDEDGQKLNDAVDLWAGSPKWSRQLSIAVPLYRTALTATRHTLRGVRHVTELVSVSLPEGVKVTRTALPRRKGIKVVDGIDLKDADEEGEIPAEWLVHEPNVAAERERNPSGEPEKIILYFHGSATHRSLTSRLSEATGCRVLSVDYRLAPEHPFPLPLHDAICAYLSLVDPVDPSSPRYHPSQIVFAGDSAGGGLSLALALWIRDNLPAERRPAGVVGMAPWVDLTHSMPSFHLETADYLPAQVTDPQHIRRGQRSHYYTPHDDWNSHRYVSPLFGGDIVARDRSSETASDDGTVGKDVPAGLPPILVQVGSRERLRDEGVALGTKAYGKSGSVRVEVYQDMVHVFQAFAVMGEEMAVLALRRIGEFVRGLPAALPSPSLHSAAEGAETEQPAGKSAPSGAEFYFIAVGGEVQAKPKAWAEATITAAATELARRGTTGSAGTSAPAAVSPAAPPLARTASLDATFGTASAFAATAVGAYWRRAFTASATVLSSTRSWVGAAVVAQSVSDGSGKVSDEGGVLRPLLEEEEDRRKMLAGIAFYRVI
ncbi:Alpha/Beta hydrolase protein [Zopfochytrium polystomum]|nr:Alpha/Beta hydrolase protein [Zopfochytrium polystomum]